MGPLEHNCPLRVIFVFFSTTGASSQTEIKYCAMEDRYAQEVEDLVVTYFVSDEPT